MYKRWLFGLLFALKIKILSLTIHCNDEYYFYKKMAIIAQLIQKRILDCNSFKHKVNHRVERQVVLMKNPWLVSNYRFKT